VPAMSVATSLSRGGNEKRAGARKFGHSTWWRSETRCPSRLGLDRAIELVIRLLLHVRWIWDSELARPAAVLPAPLAALPVRVPRLRTCSQTDSSLAWRPPSVTALAVGHKNTNRRHQRVVHRISRIITPRNVKACMGLVTAPSPRQDTRRG